MPVSYAATSAWPARNLGIKWSMQIKKLLSLYCLSSIGFLGTSASCYRGIVPTKTNEVVLESYRDKVARYQSELEAGKVFSSEHQPCEVLADKVRNPIFFEDNEKSQPELKQKDSGGFLSCDDAYDHIKGHVRTTPSWQKVRLLDNYETSESRGFFQDGERCFSVISEPLMVFANHPGFQWVLEVCEEGLNGPLKIYGFFSVP